VIFSSERSSAYSLTLRHCLFLGGVRFNIMAVIKDHAEHDLGGGSADTPMATPSLQHYIDAGSDNGDHHPLQRWTSPSRATPSCVPRTASSIKANPHLRLRQRRRNCSGVGYRGRTDGSWTRSTTHVAGNNRANCQVGFDIGLPDTREFAFNRADSAGRRDPHQPRRLQRICPAFITNRQPTMAPTA